MNQELIKTFRLVRENLNCYQVGFVASNSLKTARAILLAEELGLEVTWEYDEFPADAGDCYTDEELEAGFKSGRFENLVAYVKDYHGHILASCGGILVDNNSPTAASYKLGFEHELLAEAVAEIKRQA